MRRERGISLVELIAALAILGIAMVALLGMFSTWGGRSADPLLYSQAASILSAYSEEIRSRAFCDPDFDPDGDPSTGCPVDCTVPACSGGCGGPIPGAETRAVFDDVCDYDGLTEAPADQTGSPMPGLDRYQVRIRVRDSGVSFGSLSGDSGQVVGVEIRVTPPEGDPVVTTVYRTNQ